MPNIHRPLQELALSSLVTFDSGTQVDDALGHWRMAFRTVQAWEAWECHREWISSTSPNFGPGIKDRFVASSKIPPEKVQAMKAEREKVGAETYISNHLSIYLSICLSVYLSIESMG